MDITDREGFLSLVRELRPDVLIHAAAQTHVDRCEDEPEEAFRINASGSETAALACREAGARMVYVSTEYVFDGRSGPYAEDDEPRPLGVYARSKFRGEQLAAAALEDLVVARTTVLFGRHCLQTPNFATWLVGELRAGRPVRVVRDQVGSPTFVDNLAEMLGALALSDVRGIWNTVGRDVMSRHDFALATCRVFDLPANLVTPVLTEELGQKAPRPLRAGLRMEKFRSRFPGIEVKGVKEALRSLKMQMAGDDAGPPSRQCG
jgi:dTDP-4-dehydrorhamnose reductase